MVRPKYQVFVSSTFTDLRDERAGVTWEILKAGHIPAGMENFPASDAGAWKVIQRTIDSSDYYVLLIAGRYGTIDRATNLSWTEREYEYAREKKVPVLAFIRDLSSVAATNVDRDSKTKKLQAFISKVDKLHTREKWQHGADLNAKVAAALREEIQVADEEDRPRPGWVRGDSLPKDVAGELARLSSENAALRAKLETLETSKPRLRVLWEGAAPAASRHERSLPRYAITDEQRHTFSGLPDHVTIASECSRRLWFRFDLRNDGTAVARTIRAKFEFRDVESVEVAGVPYSHAERIGLIMGAATTTPWFEDRSRELYVERVGVDGAVGHVEQRMKSLGVGQCDPLVKMGVSLPDRFLRDGSATLSVSYLVATEDGERDEGSFEVQVRLVGTRRLSFDELNSLSSSGST